MSPEKLAMVATGVCFVAYAIAFYLFWSVKYPSTADKGDTEYCKGVLVGLLIYPTLLLFFFGLFSWVKS